jgi:hypothetical protein
MRRIAFVTCLSRNVIDNLHEFLDKSRDANVPSPMLVDPEERRTWR